MFISRDKEFSALREHLRKAMERNGSIVFISGEAGIGKTALVKQWWNETESEFKKYHEPDTPVFLETSCSIPLAGISVGEIESLQPFSDLMKQFIVLTDQNNSIRNKFNAIFIKAAPAWLDAIPIVGKIASASVKTYDLYKDSKKTEHKEAQNATSQNHIFRQYLDIVTRVTNEKEIPCLVLFIDDLHWSDYSSLNLLFYLSKYIQALPVLILATYRPEEIFAAKERLQPLGKIKNEIIRYGSGSEIRLQNFDFGDIMNYLGLYFDKYISNPDFERWLEKISDGNALFITQYIKTLTEDGYLDKNGKVLKEYTGIEEPDSVEAVINERMNRLDQNTLELLRNASCEGEEFTTLVLAKITEKKILELIQILNKAEDSGFIKKSDAYETNKDIKTSFYKFVHSLFYKTLYDSLSKEEKSILHRICYDVLKTEMEKDNKNILIASKFLAHAEMCGEYFKAGKTALSIAWIMWSKMSYPEALELIAKIMKYSKALENEDPALFAGVFKPKIEANAIDLKGDILSRMGRHSEALKFYESSLALFNEFNNLTRKCDAMSGIAYIHFRLGRKKESINISEESYKIAKEINYVYGQVSSLYNIANAKRALGESEESFKLFNDCRELSIEAGDKAGEAFILYNLGSLMQLIGKFDEAEKYIYDSLEISEKIGYYSNEANCKALLGTVYANRGKYEEALKYFEESIPMQKKTGDRFAEAWVLSKIGNVKMDTGKYSEAVDILEKSISIFRELENKEEIASVMMPLGRTYLLSGKTDLARDTLNEARALSDEFDNRLLTGMIEGELGNLDGTEGKVADAIRHFENCVKIFRELNHFRTPEFEGILNNLKKDTTGGG